jgi:hypothetical protein
MMEAARTSETLVNFYQTTWRYNPEDSHLHSHRHENLKSYILLAVSKNENLFCHDCLAVFVLTHGDEHDKVYAKDKTYFVKELVEPFTAKNCLYLANKPKLFFIQVW